MLKMTLIRMLVLAVISLCASDALAQAAAAPGGVYNLTAVNGRALPVIVEQEPGAACYREIASAVLTIDPNGGWDIRYVENESCGDDTQPVVFNEDESGDYLIVGTSVVFSTADESDDRPDEIDVDELGVGVLQGSVLNVTLEDRRNVLTFRR